MPPTSTSDDRVISMRTRRKYQPAPAAPANPASANDLERYARASEPDDFRHRMTVNAIAFLFVGVLVIAGLWLADMLATMRKNQDCVFAGKRNCGKIEAPVSTR